jgi:hypothetical protein
MAAFSPIMAVPNLSAVQESNSESEQEPELEPMRILLCGDRYAQHSPGICCFTTVRQVCTTLLALYVFEIGRADTEISLVNAIIAITELRLICIPNYHLRLRTVFRDQRRWLEIPYNAVLL